MNAAMFDALLEELASRVAALVAERLKAGALPGAIDQGASPLGRRRHIAAARRRIASGLPGAAQVGRRYLLSADALADEMRRVSGSHTEPAAPASGGVRAELERELRLVKGGAK